MSARFPHKGKKASERQVLEEITSVLKQPISPPFLFSFLLSSEATTESIYYSPRAKIHQRRNGVEIEGVVI